MCIAIIPVINYRRKLNTYKINIPISSDRYPEVIIITSDFLDINVMILTNLSGAILKLHFMLISPISKATGKE